MAQHRRRSARPSTSTSPAEIVKVRHAWTILISHNYDESLSVVVGRRDIASKRMQFVRLADDHLPHGSGAHLLRALARAYSLIADDAETRSM